MNKNMMALIGMVIALVLIIVAFVGPWYSISILGVNANYGLQNADVGGVTMEYTDAMGSGIDVFTNTMYITIVALIFAIICLIGILGAQFNFGKPATMGMLGGVFGILTFILALIAPIYFMTSAFLDQVSDVGFWNEMGGPGYAWYIMIVAAIIALITTLPLFKKQVA